MGRAVLEDFPSIAEQGRVSNGRFFGYVAGSGEPVGALAELLTAALNQNVTAWRSAPAAVTIERTVVAWLADAVGCAGYKGSLCGGGSAANLMALAMAREAKRPGNRNRCRPLHRLCFRAGPYVDPEGGGVTGYRARQSSADPGGRRFQDARRCACGGNCRRSPRRAKARGDRGNRRHREYGRHRSLVRTGGYRTKRRHVASCRRRLWGDRRAGRTGKIHRPRPRRTRCRSIRTSGSTSRSIAAACSIAISEQRGKPSRIAATT